MVHTLDDFGFEELRVDQVTSAELSQAIARMDTLCGLSEEVIVDGTALADRLQGVSRAVSSIVLARGGIEFETQTQTQTETPLPTDDTSALPRVRATNIIRKFDNPDLKLGLCFAAQPEPGDERSGARLYVASIITPNVQAPIREVVLPTDRAIDNLLMTEPSLWQDMTPYSLDINATNGRFELSHPFHKLADPEEDPKDYFRVLQELSRKLLRCM